MIKVIAVVGLGNIALRHRRNLKALFPKAQIISVPSRARQIKEEIEWADHVLFDIDALLKAQPNFVIIASPSSFHLQHASQLIKANIPLLIEKPVTSSSIDALELQSLAKKYKTPVSVAYCLRYLPSAMAMKELLVESKVGSIFNVFISVGQFLPDWRPDVDYLQSVSASKKLGGGVLLELSHELDYAGWLFGQLNIEQVILRGSKTLNIDVEAFADINLSNKLGAIFNIHLDFLQKKCQRSCSVIGSQGRLDWDLLSNTVTLHHSKGMQIMYSEPSWDKNRMYIEMIEDFVAYIDGQQNRVISLQEAVDTVKLIDDAKEKSIWRGLV